MPKKVSGATLPPAGFDTVCTSEFPPNWDFDTQDTLIGGVIRMKKAKVRRGGDVEECNILVVENDTGEHTVWESAGLADLFSNVEKGDAVWIHFTGLVDLAGRPQPMRGFDAAVQKGKGKMYGATKEGSTEEKTGRATA